MDTINDRIKLIIDHLGMNINSYSKHIGLSNDVTIRNIVAGRKSKPSFDVLMKIILSIDRVNIEWLLLGNGEMLLKNNYATEENEVLESQAGYQSINYKIEYEKAKAQVEFLEKFIDKYFEKIMDKLEITKID